MMTALLLYSYCQGIYSSRRMAKGCVERLDFMAVTGLNQPDFRTISDFRKRHLKALSGLFVQVLKLCRQAGLAKLGHVALDGTKVKASASKHKSMSYERLTKKEAELRREVAEWFQKAEPLTPLRTATRPRVARPGCRSGSPTSRRGSSASGRPRRRSRPKRSPRARPSPSPRRSQLYRSRERDHEGRG